ncbi:MAG: serine O-acetyltransferase [Dehalococcoidia bacterium]
MEPSASFRVLVLQPLKRDAEAWQSKGFAADLHGMRLLFRLATHGGYRATVLHRVAHWAHCRRLTAVPTLLHELNQALHGIEMTPSMKVGSGLYMPHSVGSVITAQEIGEGVELQGGITLGMRGSAEFPILRDGVVVSCGARILGPVIVGEGSVIGANAVVIHDVEPGAVMIGVPAKALLVDRPGSNQDSRG